MKRSTGATRIGSVGIIGSGRAATALSRAFRDAGMRVASAPGRSGAAALERLARRSQVLLLCVADEAIEPVAERLASLPAPTLSGKVVLHTSGVRGPEPLERLTRPGAVVGCLHPMVSFPPRTGPARHAGHAASLMGVIFAVDGAPPARRVAMALARKLGGQPIFVPASARPAYHMMATLVASGMAALLDAGLQIGRTRLGLTEAGARQALMPLARSVLANVSKAGAARALTGPAARGDARTIARHLVTLSTATPDLKELYRLLSRRAVRMALADKRLSPGSAARLLKTLRPDRRD